jgi:hypothetical protein
MLPSCKNYRPLKLPPTKSKPKTKRTIIKNFLLVTNKAISVRKNCMKWKPSAETNGAISPDNAGKIYQTYKQNFRSNLETSNRLTS